jgi:hypothetical protein
MSFPRLIGVLTVVAAAWCMEPGAHAFCNPEEENSCGACMVCSSETNRCVQPSCVPSGCIDDVLWNTSCCSGAAVPGSTYCINPADWGTTWASCYHTCA